MASQENNFTSRFLWFITIPFIVFFLLIFFLILLPAKESLKDIHSDIKTGIFHHLADTPLPLTNNLNAGRCNVTIPNDGSIHANLSFLGTPGMKLVITNNGVRFFNGTFTAVSQTIALPQSANAYMVQLTDARDVQVDLAMAPNQYTYDRYVVEPINSIDLHRYTFTGGGANIVIMAEQGP